MEDALEIADTLAHDDLVIHKTAARGYVAVGVRDFAAFRVLRRTMQGGLYFVCLVIRFQRQRAGREHIDFFRKRIVAVQFAGSVRNGQIRLDQLADCDFLFVILRRQCAVRRGLDGRKNRAFCSKLCHNVTS